MCVQFPPSTSYLNEGGGYRLRAAKRSDNLTAARISFRRDNSDEAIETLGLTWKQLENETDEI